MNRIDPSGHQDCSLIPSTDGRASCEAANKRESLKAELAKLNSGNISSFSNWELEALINLYNGGPDGVHAAEYLITHKTSFGNVAPQNGVGGAWHPDRLNYLDFAGV